MASYDYRNLVQEQRRFFRAGRTGTLSFRKHYLGKMYNWIEENEREILEALRQDLHKAPFEAYATEVGFVKGEIRHALKHLKKWARPRRKPTPLTQFPAASFVYPEPYGVVLIMAPWNYPFQLAVGPLVAAVSAGNCAVVKPSGYAPASSAVVAKMVKEVFPPQYVCVVQGGREENQGLLNEKFDYIFFTGSGSVGRYVLEKAARHLTPVSLELGGKSPCIVDETADIRLAARRIVWGKFLNSGQTCVAPDYILVQRKVKDRLLKEMERQIRKMYGERPCENEEYPKMISLRHFERVLRLMDDAHIVCGGGSCRRTLQIEPTILDGVGWDHASMREEIFGPVLPVLSFYEVREAVQMIRAGQRPLALYLFTKSDSRRRRILRTLSFGGGCINDTIVHLATPHMPFGGVGESGMGSYHGKAGFDTFTHRKSIMRRACLLDLPLRYAPYKKKLDLLRKIQR